ncbi:unnamed protein product [Rotaria magnacalcarata]|uniref:Uncharacterized protein n=1 Tax=Rotaria magnacalcarata TaxID=392030 RepID=A0A816H5I8_9BILA|nr:unnamed protein product [Rotaria magnacalcarata]
MSQIHPHPHPQEKFYHGDLNRDNNFWVYPRDKPVQNPDWDTYDASDLCNNCGGMEGADIGVGWVDTEGKDRHAFDFAKPVIDNTTDNWLALRGRESNG